MEDPMSTRRPSSDSPRSNDSSVVKKPQPRRAPRVPRPEGQEEIAPAPAPALMTRRIEISADTRRGMIAEAAYLRAERRGFEHGHDVEDWLAAEAEVNALLQHGQSTTAQ
jgi:hypothetical protein